MRGVIVVLVMALLGGCAAEPAEESAPAEQADQTPAQIACEKLSMDVLAAQDDRIAYLKSVQDEVQDVGLGIGPAVNVTIMAAEQKKGRQAIAEGYAMIERSCGLANQ